ncbi:hypothetical protein [Lactococcus allomyrinae]|uniref:Uncharacterized protein n=1 Tax=Lactococcus allomyrinae TaxID=2419773 RepID=A0A387BF95_9LACT|nr:hypothetical protein [Lactococcus allomyrinae]AYF99775.1 hypothetical protein D7I46_00940 [Lactococcus allomyrinae]
MVMSDPKYKDLLCPYCGTSNRFPTAWAEDQRCIHCDKWMVHKDKNIMEEELRVLKEHYQKEKNAIYERYRGNYYEPHLKVIEEGKKV